jgi:hypothetical protein
MNVNKVQRNDLDLNEGRKKRLEKLHNEEDNNLCPLPNFTVKESKMIPWAENVERIKEMRNACSILPKSLKGTYYLEFNGEDRRIIIECILNN